MFQHDPEPSENGEFSVNRSDVLWDDPSVLRIERPEDNAPRLSSREVTRMSGVGAREIRQWLPPSSGSYAERALATISLDTEGHNPERALARTPKARHQAHAAARYSSIDLQLLRSARELRRQDVPAKRIRAAFASLKRRLPAGNSPLALRLIAEGRRVIVRDLVGTWEAESGQMLFDYASEHSLWPPDAAVPPKKTAGALEFLVVNEKPVAPNVLRFEDRRRLDVTALDWYGRARHLDTAGEEGVVDAYREALRLDPELVDAHIDLGRYLHEAGDLRRARRSYTRAVELEPKSATSFFNLGVVLEDLGFHDQAMESYIRTVALDPEYSDAYFNLSRLYEVRGERAAALRCLQSYRRTIKT